MASNVITFITTVAALTTCLLTVSGQFYSYPYPLPDGVNCTTSNNTACTQRYPNTVCRHEEVCKYGKTCVCATGYALYSFFNSTLPTPEYSCRPAIELGQNCAAGPCGANAFCDNSKLCRCKPGYKTYNATDCTHYVPGETCPVTECEFPEKNNYYLPCDYGTCKDGIFACIPGSKWLQYSTLNGERPSPLVDGMCLKNKASVVGTGELCDISDNVCRSNRCVSCPERSDVKVCNGATFSKTMSAATALLLLLACYFFH